MRSLQASRKGGKKTPALIERFKRASSFVWTCGVAWYKLDFRPVPWKKCFYFFPSLNYSSFMFSFENEHWFNLFHLSWPTSLLYTNDRSPRPQKMGPVEERDLHLEVYTLAIKTHQFWDVSISCSVVSDSLQPHGLQPTRLLYPWDSPGKNTGVGCHFLLHLWCKGLLTLLVNWICFNIFLIFFFPELCWIRKFSQH